MLFRKVARNATAVKFEFVFVGFFTGVCLGVFTSLVAMHARNGQFVLKEEIQVNSITNLEGGLAIGNAAALTEELCDTMPAYQLQDDCYCLRDEVRDQFMSARRQLYRP